MKSEAFPYTKIFANIIAMLDILIGVFLLGLGLLILLVYRRDKTTDLGAPFETLEPHVVTQIIELLEIKPGEVFFDLGSGDGRLVIVAAMVGAKAYGVEIDKFRFWYSKLWLKFLRLGGKAEILHKNIFEVDLSHADIVIAYLLPETHRRLLPKLKKELKKGARVVGVAFKFPGWKAAKVIRPGTKYGPVYLYKV